MRSRSTASRTSTCRRRRSGCGRRSATRKRPLTSRLRTSAGMDQATHLHVGATRSSDARIIAGVSAAHFVSHYYILLLAPLFGFVRAEYNVTYTELALALAVFDLVSGTLQTPAGFLVDLISARLTLIYGLVLGSLAFVVVGLVNSYWVLVAMFAVAGVVNTVY